MAGVFKSLDQSDVRVTPFRTHKLWSETVGFTSGSVSGSVFSTTAGDIVSITNIKCLNPQAANNYDYAYAIVATENSGSVLCAFDVEDGFNFIAAYEDAQLDGQFLHYEFIDTNSDPTFILAALTGSMLATLDTGSLASITTGDYSSVSDPTGTTYSLFYHTPPSAGGPMKGYLGVNTVGGSNGLIQFDLDTANALAENFVDITDLSYPQPVAGDYKMLWGQVGGDEVYSLTDIGGTYHMITHNVGGPNVTGYEVIPFASTPTSDVLQYEIYNEQAFWRFEDDTALHALNKTGYYTNSNISVAAILQPNSQPRTSVTWTDYTFTDSLFIVTTDGYILWDLELVPNVGLPWGGAGTITYGAGVDARQYMSGGQVISATTNKDVKNFYSGSDTLITIFASGPENTKTPSSVFTYNVTTDTFTDPVHLGYTTWIPQITTSERKNTAIAAEAYSTVNLSTGHKKIKLYKINI